MFDSKWAIDTAAVVARLTNIIMMIFAKVSCTAEVEGFSTAFVTLPSDVFMAVNRTVVLTSANLFNSASFADKVLLLRRFCHLKVTFTLNLAAVIRLLAGVTLVKCRLFHHILHRCVLEPLAIGVRDRSHVDHI